jgi:GT2 family glycosyltransferase
VAGALLEFSQQPGVGVVGGKTYQRNDLIWHAGIIVPRATPHLVRLDDLITRNYSAVSGGCLMTRRDVFDAVGGFEPADRVGCVDIDYCLRAQAIGQRTVFTPHARLRHLTSAPSEPDAEQRRIFRDHWGPRLPVDPFYNCNFRQDAAWFVVGLTQT